MTSDTVIDAWSNNKSIVNNMAPIKKYKSNGEPRFGSQTAF